MKTVLISYMECINAFILSIVSFFEHLDLIGWLYLIILWFFLRSIFSPGGWFIPSPKSYDMTCPICEKNILSSSISSSSSRFVEDTSMWGVGGYYQVTTFFCNHCNYTFDS